MWHLMGKVNTKKEMEEIERRDLILSEGATPTLKRCCYLRGFCGFFKINVLPHGVL